MNINISLARLCPELDRLLAGVLISRAVRNRIARSYGANAYAEITSNPYLLCDMDGVGFKSADRLAERMGFKKNDPRRIQQGILHRLKENCFINGHVCIPANQLIGDAQSTLGVTRDEIKDGIAQLDSADEIRFRGRAQGDNVYLKKYWFDELWIAEKLVQVNKSPANVDSRNVDVEDLKPDQVIALEKMARCKISCLIGAPGVGKTYTVKKLIGMYSHARISIAAPTGKAAKRVTELTGHDASTIHRLLEAAMGEDGFYFQRDEDFPLEADVVILDECSMIDQPLFASFLRALPDECRLIMVGDVNQLPPVGPGNVFRDILNSGVVPVAELTEIKRQEPGLIVTNCHAIKDGQKFKRPEHGDTSQDILLCSAMSLPDIKDAVVRCMDYLIGRGFNPIKEVQVLSPFRDSDGICVSCKPLNDALQEKLNPRSLREEKKLKFRMGDKVIQTRNDYDNNVMNGEIGQVVSVDSETLIRTITVRFQDPERDIQFEYRENKLALAYAITTHKFQGSEQRVVVFPVHPSLYPNFVQRNWLYTTISRAQELCVIIGRMSELDHIIGRNKKIRRNTNLKELLEEEAIQY